MQTLMTAQIPGAVNLVHWGGHWVIWLNALRASAIVLDTLGARLAGGWVWDDMTITCGPGDPAGDQELLRRLTLVAGLDQAERDEISTALLHGLRVEVDPGRSRDHHPAPPNVSDGSETRLPALLPGPPPAR